jgi:hypothetical protein
LRKDKEAAGKATLRLTIGFFNYNPVNQWSHEVKLLQRLAITKNMEDGFAR